MPVLCNAPASAWRRGAVSSFDRGLLHSPVIIMIHQQDNKNVAESLTKQGFHMALTRTWAVPTRAPWVISDPRSSASMPRVRHHFAILRPAECPSVNIDAYGANRQFIPVAATCLAFLLPFLIKWNRIHKNCYIWLTIAL